MDTPLTNIDLAQSYIGKTLADLPVPSFVLNRTIIDQNAKRMFDKLNAIHLQSSAQSKLKFRPHVKTLKCVEVTRAALGNGYTKSVVASTVAEIKGLLPLVKSGDVNDILYGVPIGFSKIDELALLAKSYKSIAEDFNLRVLVDHPAQVQRLGENGQHWSLFIKTDSHDNRAGVPIGSVEFKEILELIKRYSSLSLFGFYVHAGTSYEAEDLDAAKTHLHRELTTVHAAAEVSRDILGSQVAGPFILSFGATPTAHAVSHADIVALAPNSPDQLELHAGNFVALDLQQASSSLASRDSIAGYVQSEICSIYGAPRHEFLINAGVLALSREPGRWGGLAHVQGKPDWKVVRVSQEHGTLAYVGDNKDERDGTWTIGDRLFLYPQHMCITSAMHSVYFVIDEAYPRDETVIVDVYMPWRGW